VASRLAGEEMLIIAWRQADCRELSRIIRADLIHLGLVDGGRSVTIAEGARASAGDLVVARKNDPRMQTDPGHTLANHDIFRIESVTGRGLMVRRVIDGKDRVRLAARPVLYPISKFATTELAYAVTAHKGQGGTYEAGEPLVTGTESREWLYTAMTRGWRRNAAHAVTQPARADPAPGTRPDPELARQRDVDRERAGLPAEGGRPGGTRADGGRRAGRLPGPGRGRARRADYQRTSLANADHLAAQHAEWSRPHREGRPAAVREAAAGGGAREVPERPGHPAGHVAVPDHAERGVRRAGCGRRAAGRGHVPAAGGQGHPE
jgi:hypothetical protein